MCFMLYYALAFMFYTLVRFLAVFRKFLDHSIPNLTINECSLTPYGHPQVTIPVKGRKEECRASGKQGWSVVVPTVHGGPLSPNVVGFLMTVQLPGSFNSIISNCCSISRSFCYINASFQPHSTAHPVNFPPYPSHHLVGIKIRLERVESKLKVKIARIPD